MNHSDFAPLSVLPYSKDALVNLIRAKTGLGPRDHISQKVQLTYLCKYLESDHINAKTIVIEDEYIDRNYLEDYAEYYARCFSNHPKKCCRVHFFSNTFDAGQFASALERFNAKFIEGIQEYYLGHAVIRPIPETFLGRLCIAPYQGLLNSKRAKLIAKPQLASLFGIQVRVETTPFVEQDKVVSACATSALWTLLNVSQDSSAKHIPSPSAITKSAHQFLDGGSRTFPTSGLTPQQVTRSLKEFGLEPTVLHLGGAEISLDELKEITWAYVRADIPILVGGSVYRVDRRKRDSRLLGPHFICALGFQQGNLPSSNSSDIQLLSHSIDKIYVHDDRYGPYVRLQAKLQPIPTRKSTNREKQIMGLALSLHGETKDFFVPEIIVVGLYHKVRIPYDHARAVCESLRSHFDAIQSTTRAIAELVCAEKTQAKSAQKKQNLAGKADYWQEVSLAAQALVQGLWDISLTTSSALKNEILHSQSAICFNSSADKAAALTQSMPKYIWRCRIFSKQKNALEPQTDILLDATEVPQGPTLVGYITYNNAAESVWQLIDQWVENHLWNELSDSITAPEDDSQEKQYAMCVPKFFSDARNKRNFLNILYGPLRIPNRDLKDGEFDWLDNVEHRTDVITIRRGNDALSKYHLEKTKKYIWLINESGDLVLGEDISRENGEKQGHPTLIDGKPARLGGELYFNKGKWRVNLRSGAYSNHLRHQPEAAKVFLVNVIGNNFASFVVHAEIEALS